MAINQVFKILAQVRKKQEKEKKDHRAFKCASIYLQCPHLLCLNRAQAPHSVLQIILEMSQQPSHATLSLPLLFHFEMASNVSTEHMGADNCESR